MVLYVATAAFEEAATRRVLFGLLFISLAEEEGAEIVALLQPLLALLRPTGDCSDEDTAICLPGEAGKMNDYIYHIYIIYERTLIHETIFKIHTDIRGHYYAMTTSERIGDCVLVIMSRWTTFLIWSLTRLTSAAMPG